ncbi:MAG: hypothetical protein BWY06_02966 [Candidatus Latescibacteria bacterium ADurb.Bin168]|nr:MAG: hypothetical protein BWY06_02966 [Candidatus Latescibacteria bacterium ADurb.Bin168]
MRTQYLDYPIQVTTPAPGVEAVETTAPGARERILAPWKGAVEVNEYTLVRSKPILAELEAMKDPTEAP